MLEELKVYRCSLETHILPRRSIQGDHLEVDGSALEPLQSHIYHFHILASHRNIPIDSGFR